MTILVDHRERGSGVVDALEELRAQIEECALEVADYVVARSVGVKRKTVHDLHRSIRDRRLWQQVASLRVDLDAAFLIVEGASIDRGPVSRAGVRGALLEVISLGIPVIRSGDAADTASWIVRIAARASRRQSPRHPRRSRSRTPATPAAVLTAIPGISPRVAAELLERLGDIASIAAASDRDLRSVPGIGRLRAAVLSEILNGRKSEGS